MALRNLFPKLCFWMVCAVQGCVVPSAATPTGQRSATPNAAMIPAAYRETKTMIFGGVMHDVYLGCISCPSYATDSIHNVMGPHGSMFSQDSLHNTFSPYRSSFSFESACNSMSTHPPVVVDGAGNFYGYFTVNESHPRRVKTEELLTLLKSICE